MTISAGVHTLKFRIKTEHVELLSALRHGEPHNNGFLLYLHRNGIDDPCPVNIWAGESVGGIATKPDLGVQLKEILPRRFKRMDRGRVSLLIGIRTDYCYQLTVTQPTGHIICERIDENFWNLTTTFEIGRNLPSLFITISPYLLPLT